MKLKPDGAYALRVALEPLTHDAVGEQQSETELILLASIAISLRRIADHLTSLGHAPDAEISRSHGNQP